MKIAFLIGVTIISFSCYQKKTGQTEDVESLATTSVVQADFKNDRSLQKDDCHVWLADSDTALLSGEFIRYIKENDGIRIQWGNNHFTRTLRNDYECDGAPSWVPTIRWTTAKYIGLKYGCGSPCWGTIVLPINDRDSVIERMYDLEIDTSTHRMVYLDNVTYDKLIVENFETGQKININYKFECKAAFAGYCIDSLKLSRDKLVITWVNWSKDEKVKNIVIEEFEL